jgi:retron-type reverse transcriptase
VLSFDSVPWELVLKAVAHHTDQKWVLLYVERWLKAPLQHEDGSLVERGLWNPSGFGDDRSHAIANFEFERSIRRVSRRSRP